MVFSKLTDLCAVLPLPVLDNHLLGGVNELACGAFPWQILVLSFDELETLISHNLTLCRSPTPLSSQLVRFSRSLHAVRLRIFYVGFDVTGWRDLTVCPHVHVVLQRGGSLDRRHDRNWNGLDIAVFVADVAAHITPEV